MDTKITHDGEPPREKRRLTNEEILEHVRKNYQMVRLGDTVKSCVDGRDNKPVIGIPGGDAGLFVSMISALEQIAGEKIDENKLLEIFNRYQEQMGDFYIHSDSHAEHIKHEVEHKGGDVNEDCSCIGCGHLRLAMGGNKPEAERDIHVFNEEYGVRPELVSLFFKMIDEERKKGNAKIKSTTLEGGHGEAAVVVVKNGESFLTPDSQISALTPCVKDEQGGDQQVFVFHEQVANYMLEQIANKIKDISGQDIDFVSFLEKIKQIFEKQKNATLGHLAKGLPVYEVAIMPPEHKITVEAKGQI